MIGVFDSGEGGLSVLKEIVRLLPNERYVYYSDNANCPYGDKSQEFIQGRADNIVRRLLAEGCDIIVVACNTATAAAISMLRERYSDVSNPEVRARSLELTSGRHDHIRFIGMEPAVKPAALGTGTGVIGVLATAGTLKGSKYLNTKGKVDDSIKVVEHVGQGFVELVERGVLDGQEAERVVSASLCPLLDAGADIIVLGCTHYPFLLPVMRKIAGPDIRFIDPAPAVARRTVHVMGEEGLLPASSPDSLAGQKDIAAVQCWLSRPDIEALGDMPGTDSVAKPSTDVMHKPATAVRLLSSGDPGPLHRLYSMLYLD